MNRMNKVLAFIALIGLLFILYKAKWRSPLPSPTQDILIVGTNAEFYPFTFIEEGHIVGFDIDIAKEVAQRMGKRAVFKDMPFEALLLELQRGTIQVIAAGMTPAEGRNVLFTKPYVENDYLVVITLAQSPITSLEDLRDKEITVNDGFTADMYMSSLDWPKLRRFKTVTDSFLALRNGQVFAYATGMTPIKAILEHYGPEKFNIFKIPGTTETTALAVAKNNHELLHAIDTVLDEMKEDGTIDALKTKWHLA